MAKLTKDEVLHIARLSKLELTEGEIKKFTLQLSEILAFFKELKELDIEDVVPTSQTTGLENVYSDDVVKPENSLSVEDAISGTNNSVNNLFVVPMLLSQRSDK